MIIASKKFGTNESKLEDALETLGFTNGTVKAPNPPSKPLTNFQYKEHMKSMRKPFYFALPVPALHPHTKEPSSHRAFMIKAPNADKNKAVFNRLYERRKMRTNINPNINPSYQQANSNPLTDKSPQRKVSKQRKVLHRRRRRNNPSGDFRSKDRGKPLKSLKNLKKRKKSNFFDTLKFPKN